MRASYQASRKATRLYEGGKVDDPDDNGGRTAYGVTKAVYDAYRRNKHLPLRDVWSISEPEIDEIYLDQYWIPASCDELPPGVDLMVFDAAIHSGVTRSIMWLQRACGATYKGIVDGHFGQKTRDAVRAVAPATLIANIATRRMAFLKQLADWPKYKNGWTRRVSAVSLTATALLNAPGSIPVAIVSPPTPKAPVTAVKDVPTTAAGDAATGVGIASASFSATLEGVRAQLQPYASTSAFIQKLVIFLVLLGAVLTFGGLAYRYYQTRRIAARRDALDLPLSDADARATFAALK